MTRLITAADEVEALQARSAEPFVRLVRALIRARVAQDGDAYARAMRELAGLLGRVGAFANLLGRRRMQLLADQAARGMREGERALHVAGAVAMLKAWGPALPVVDFKEAIAEILNRKPELAKGYKAVQDVYAERHGFAMAKSTDMAVTTRVQALISEHIKGGKVLPSPRQALDALGDWTRAYSDTVYETNVKTAYTAGMWQRLETPEVARVLPGARFVSALMVTSRPNHTAAHGFMASTDAPEWNYLSPPLGYRCHCTVREISIFEARERGILDPNGRLVTVRPAGFEKAAPDEGFGRARPDHMLG